MALADLVQTLEQDAAAELRAVLAAADTRAAELEAKAARDRVELAAIAGQTSNAECRVEADAQLATAQRTAREQLLLARAEMLERVLATARELLPDVTRRVASELAAAAIACAGAQPGVLRTLPELARDLRPLLPATLQIEPALEVATGVIIDLANGTQIVATLDALLEREWPKLAATLLSQLAKETGS